MDEAQSRKRARPVVSCLRCREKKLKCDRALPCENCVRASCSSDCKYNHGLGGADYLPRAKRIQASAESTGDAGSRPNEASPVASVGIIEDLQQRVASLERLLGTKPLSSQAQEDPSPANRNKAAVSPNVLGTLTVKGSRTRYHGQNDRVALLDQFTDAKKFLSLCRTDDSLRALIKEVQFLQRRAEAQARSPGPEVGAEASPTLLKLREFLPPRPVCDHLFSVYTKTFEKSLRIIHIPAFERQYNKFWTSPDPNVCQNSPFLPQLTSILVLSSALEDPKSRDDQSVHSSYLKVTALDLVLAWLDEIARKQRTELSTLQVQTLALLARVLQHLPVEKIWTAAGELVRSAMVMGLHLDPTRFAKISPFQAELRRRLWITIVELDLQSSITAGMPIMTPKVNFEPLTPSNINDVDFDESISKLPESKPLNEWTNSLAQVSLATSLPHRIKAMNLMKITSPGVDLAEVLSQGQKIGELLRLIPSPLDLEDAINSHASPEYLLNCVLLDIYTRRPLLCLYRPILVENMWDDPSFCEIQKGCLESALAILSYQDCFDPAVADLNIFDSNLYWHMFQIFCKKDILWAALSVCQYIKSSTQQSSATRPSTEVSTSRVCPGLAIRGVSYSKASLTRIVENTLDGLVRRLSVFGSDIKDIIFLSVALQSSRSHGSSDLRDSLVAEGAKKVLTACKQQLLNHKGQIQGNSMLAEQQSPLQTPRVPYSHTNSISQYPSTGDSAPTAVQPDILTQFSTLATEFNSFEGDIFSFVDGNFAMDNSWNFNNYWQ